MSLLPMISECWDDPFAHIDKAAIDVSKKVKRGGRIIQSIVKYYRITEVQYSGNAWFDSKGDLVDKVDDKQALYKNRIQYQGEIFEHGLFIKHVLLFN